MEQFIETFGYWAVALGTFFEGETILLIGAFAAHRGYLNIYGVIGAAFLGSLLGDQLYFYLGRKYGQSFLNKRPSWNARSARARALLDRYGARFILSFRFLYGLRTVSSFAIGLTTISFPKFIALNAIGAAIWAAALGAAGYLLGEVLQRWIEEIERYELAVVAGVAVLGLVLAVLNRLRKRSKR